MQLMDLDEYRRCIAPEVEKNLSDEQVQEAMDQSYVLSGIVLNLFDGQPVLDNLPIELEDLPQSWIDKLKGKISVD
jgi:hypothetical protein